MRDPMGRTSMQSAPFHKVRKNFVDFMKRETAMKKISFKIKSEDMPKKRMPVVINQHGSIHLPKNIFRRKREKDALRREVKELF